PSRKQMKEIKEQVTDELLPKAFSIHRDTLVWLDTRNHWLVIDAAAAAKADEVMSMLAHTSQHFTVVSLSRQQSPGCRVTNWLLADTPPGAFTIDQEAELRSTSESRATVRFVRHSIDIEDVRRHIEAGKQCTRLALTWNDRIAFVLTDAFEIKR